jgi:hypothetical protein
VPDELKEIKTPAYSLAVTTESGKQISTDWFTHWDATGKGVNALNKAVNGINASFPFSFSVTATPSGFDEAWSYDWKDPEQGGGLRLVRDGADNQFWFGAPSLRVGLPGDDASFIEPFVDDGAGALTLNPAIGIGKFAHTIVAHAATASLTSTTTLATQSISVEAGTVIMRYENPYIFGDANGPNSIVVEFLIDGVVVAPNRITQDFSNSTAGPVSHFIARQAVNFSYTTQALSAGAHTFAVLFYYGAGYTGSSNSAATFEAGRMVVENFY